jgi:uncharacterized damage-inducible protein DinB
MELDFALLYDYAVWANDRVLAAAERLTPEQWTQSLGHSFDSVHATMVHVLSSEHLWLTRWQGVSLRERIRPGQLPDVAAVRARWAEVARDLRAFLATAEWERVIGYTTLDGQPSAYPLWQMYLQVINHGTHHRAEAASMLTALGQAPEPLDLIIFFRERGQHG